MDKRRDLSERLEDIIVDAIENSVLDAFSNYLLDVSSLTCRLEYKMLTEEDFALKMEEVKVKFSKL